MNLFIGAAKVSDIRAVYVHELPSGAITIEGFTEREDGGHCQQMSFTEKGGLALAALLTEWAATKIERESNEKT